MTKISNRDESLPVHQEKGSFGKFDEFGRFLPDARQMEAALSISASPTLIEQMREMIRGEQLAKEARDSGTETFEEANDFFVEEDPDSLVYSPYELDEDDAIEIRLAAARAGIDVLAVEAAASAEPPLEPLKTPPKRREPAPEGKGRKEPVVDDGDDDDSVH